MLFRQYVADQRQRQALTRSQCCRQFGYVLHGVGHGAFQANCLAQGVAEKQAAFDDHEQRQCGAGIHQIKSHFVEYLHVHADLSVRTNARC